MIDFNDIDFFEKDDIIDLLNLTGKHTELLKDLIGRRVKMNPTSQFFNYNENKSTDGVFQDGTIVELTNGSHITDFTIRDKVYLFHVLWDGFEGTMSYGLRDLILI